MKEKINKIEIIELDPSNWNAYKLISLESLKEEPQSFGKSYEEATKDADEKWQARLERSGKKESDIILFAKVDNKIAGIIATFFNKGPDTQDSAMIYGAYVNKFYRGNGIGQKLVLAIIEKLNQIQGLLAIKLMVTKEDIIAQHVYQKLGFKNVGTTEWLLGDGLKHDLYIMERKILK